MKDITGEAPEISVVVDEITKLQNLLKGGDVEVGKREEPGKKPNDKEIINSIFRQFHTIKGVAGFLNIQKINQLSHNLENLLNAASVNGEEDDDWMEEEKKPQTPVGEILVSNGKMKEDDLKNGSVPRYCRRACYFAIDGY